MLVPGAAGTSGEIKPGHGTLSLGYRNVYANQYFLNGSVFREENRLEEPTRLWNTLDLTGTYQLTRRVNLQATVPLQWNQATFLVPFTEGPAAEAFRQRLSTSGVGDLLLVERTWLMDPERVKRGNVLVGLGLKLPTGNYRGGNTWTGGGPGVWNNKPAPLTIMIGDGGVDVLAEVLAYRIVRFPVKKTNFFAVGSYLITPQGTTGIPSQNLLIGPPISTSPLTQNSLVNTIPDVYSLRAGMIIPSPWKENKYLRPFSGLIAYRWDGSPQRDFIGNSNGFRQPGFFMAVELGLFYQHKRHLVQATSPISFVRYASFDSGGELQNSPAPRTTAFSPASLAVRYTYFF
jgi:hypothetical protein